MTRYNRGGFTVIETMLVVAVGALLTAGVLAGSAVAIERQRYKESVTSLQAFVQDGYNMTIVSQNTREQPWVCNAETLMHTGDAAGAVGVGKSDCTLVGRYITVDSAGVMTARSVVAYDRGVSQRENTSLTEAYTFRATSDEAEGNDRVGLQKNIPWSAHITDPGGSDTGPSEASVLVIRSPIDNSIITYADNRLHNPDALDDGLINNSSRQELLMCVESDSWFSGRRLGVRIEEFATNPSAVMIPDDEDEVCS